MSAVQKIYEISKTSKKLLKNMDHKVKFTVLANKEEADERIVTFLSKYSALSSKNFCGMDRSGAASFGIDRK